MLRMAVVPATCSPRIQIFYACLVWGKGRGGGVFEYNSIVVDHGESTKFGTIRFGRISIIIIIIIIISRDISLKLHLRRVYIRSTGKFCPFLE